MKQKHTITIGVAIVAAFDFDDESESPPFCACPAGSVVGAGDGERPPVVSESVAEVSVVGGVFDTTNETRENRTSY